MSSHEKNRLIVYIGSAFLCFTAPIFGIPMLILVILIDLAWILLCKAQPKGSSNDIL